ncbi:MAG: hypothetical protein V4667_13730 [Bacteroidota bacterium]
MIKYLKHNEIDKQKWNECILNSFNGIVYAYTHYLDVVCPNWEALVKDDYEMVMPLTWNKKYGKYYIYQPPFTQQLGVFSKEHLTEKIVEKFLLAIPKHFQFLEFNLNTYNKLSNKEYNSKAFLTHELDMISPYEFLYKSYSENTKRNLKKANHHQLKILNNCKVDEIINLFKKNKGKEVKAFKPEHYVMLNKLYNKFYKVGFAKAFAVCNSANEIIAGALFFFSNNKAIFLFSGNSTEGKEKAALFFLIDQFIKNHSEKNLTLDFEGSNNPTLARFYKSFGSKPITYLHVKKNDLPFYLKWLKK